MSDSQHLTSERASYSAEHFEPLFAAEDRHFWFRSRNRCIAAAAKLIPNAGAIHEVLEHGCGTGFVLAELQRLFPNAQVTGADPFAEGLALARRRFAGPLIQTDLIGAGFREQFDLIGLFDVLEHLDDDIAILRAIREQLRPSGRLLLTVPAHMALWSDYDLASGHRRRYSRFQLETQLVAAGFKIEYCTGFMFALQPLVYLRRRLHGVLNSRSKKAETANERIKSELEIHPILNRILALLLWPEPMWIARGWRLPGGTSILALAVRS